MSTQIDDFDFAFKKSRQAAFAAERNSHSPLSPADLDDLVQVALIGYWRGWTRQPHNVGYAYASARNAAVKFLYRCLIGRNPFALSLEDVGHGAEPGDSLMVTPDPEDEDTDKILNFDSQDFQAAVAEILLHSRSKKGRRGAQAARRDAAIVCGLASGLSPAVVAGRLGLPVEHVKTYRKRARKVLEAYLQAHPRRCVLCGSAESLTRHHIVPRRCGGDYAPDNLAWLCKTCHAQVENIYLRQERPGMSPDDWRRIFQSINQREGEAK